MRQLRRSNRQWVNCCSHLLSAKRCEVLAVLSRGSVMEKAACGCKRPLDPSRFEGRSVPRTPFIVQTNAHDVVGRAARLRGDRPHPAVGLDSGPIRTPASSERQLATFELLPGKTLAQRLVEGDATSDQGTHDEKALSCYHRFYCARGGSCAGCGHV